ncbi:MAG TPA: response regulator transcription factor [Verrucomicrobiae bacterium]
MSKNAEDGQIQVALVEDDDEIRANLAYRISSRAGYRLAAACADAESALAELPRHKPDVVLMDINLPGMDGVECVRRLKPRMTETQFVMLTVYEDSNRLFKSLVAGASGYLLKRTSTSRLMEAIREAHRGGSPMTPQIARLVVRHFQQPAEAASEVGKLTAREKDVLDQLSKGFRYKEIVGNLGISEGTLHSHIRNIYEKLHVHSRTEAVVKYLHP